MALPYCVLTIVLSSFLYFLIQTLAAKALLPIFGGVPSVWNICLIFFQGMLLLGYFYSFLTTRFFSARLQRVIHFSLILCSMIMIPILWTDIRPQATIPPALNVLWLLTIKLGIPIFIVSTTAPLVQYWFGQTRDPQAKDPYFLYSASNIGSLFALLGFPLLFEPFVGLQTLSLAWSFIYIAFTLLLLTTAWQLRPRNSLAPEIIAKSHNSITWQRRVQWLLLSFAPSTLLMASTQYITTEIVSTPMLWILPLTLYLLTFIIAFARKPIISHQWMVREQAVFLIFLLVSLSKDIFTLPSGLLLLFHMVGFFALVMVCLGELVGKRPDKSYLTEFYLWIALGGFLGGIFNGIIAPLIFNGIYEYYIAICLCVALRPWPKVNNKYQWSSSDFLMSIVIGIVLTVNYFLFTMHYSFIISQNKFSYFKFIDLFVITAVIIIILAKDQRPFRFSVNLMILFFYAQALPGFTQGDLLWQSRNFFGVTKVYKNSADNLHFLMSGTTLHGLEIMSKSIEFNRVESYYQPIQLIANLLTQNKIPLKIGIAGLGVGMLGCQFSKQDAVTFFEIDPVVVKIANMPTMFTYLKNCPPTGGVILGDARLNIANAPPHFFNVIIIDVFSSDAIPMHLVTREALQLYSQKLAPDGLIIFNISNRHIDLVPVLSTAAKQMKLETLLYLSGKLDNQFQAASEWIVLTKNNKISEKLQPIWKKLDTSQARTLWTDDHSNILGILK
jgi:hypothetical protein